MTMFCGVGVGAGACTGTLTSSPLRASSAATVFTARANRDVAGRRFDYDVLLGVTMFLKVWL